LGLADARLAQEQHQIEAALGELEQIATQIVVIGHHDGIVWELGLRRLLGHRRRRRMRKTSILTLSLISPYQCSLEVTVTFSAGGAHLRCIDDPLELAEH